MSDYIKQNGVESCRFDSSESWVILSEIEQRIKTKIEAVGTPLKDWDINIYRGILTGYNEAFIIDKVKKEEILANCQTDEERQKTAEIIRPILRGRDIKRYGYEFADLYLINTHNGVKEKGIKRINIEDYPAVKTHLDLFYPQLEKRADQGDTPYNLRNCAYIEDFYKQKIAWNRIASEKQFSLIDADIFIQDSMHFFTGKHLNFLTAVLNSRLYKILMHMIVGQAAGGNAGNSDNVKQLKVVVPNQFLEDKIIQLLKEKKYKEIDKLIYELYNLTEEEISFIENI